MLESGIAHESQMPYFQGPPLKLTKRAQEKMGNDCWYSEVNVYVGWNLSNKI